MAPAPPNFDMNCLSERMADRICNGLTAINFTIGDVIDTIESPDFDQQTKKEVVSDLKKVIDKSLRIDKRVRKFCGEIEQKGYT